MFDKNAAKKLLADSVELQKRGSASKPFNGDFQFTVPADNSRSTESVLDQSFQEKAPAQRGTARTSLKGSPKEKAQNAREAARVLQSLDTGVRSQVNVFHTISANMISPKQALGVSGGFKVLSVLEANYNSKYSME